MVVMSVVMALITPLIFAAREMVEADQLRTATNQGIRAASDLIGTDIRIAGERFPLSNTLPLPPIEIIQATSGADTIALRRNLWEGAFPICQNVGTSATTIIVERPNTWANAGTYPECLQPNTGGWPVNVSQVRALANTLTGDPEGELRAYIHDPANDRGEFFDFNIPDATTAAEKRRITVTSGAFDYSYSMSNRPLIYVLEDRQYQLQGGIMELAVNGAAPLRVAAGVSDFQALYVLDDGTTATALTGGNTWKDIRSVEITVSAESTEGPETVDRTLTYRYFPRNVLSR